MNRPTRGPVRYAGLVCLVFGALLFSRASPPSRVARASPPPSAPAATVAATPVPIRYLDGSTKGPKPASSKGSTPNPSMPACAKVAYATLAAEVAGLKAAHGDRTPAFWKAYEARKLALVGKTAMDAAGCKP